MKMKRMLSIMLTIVMMSSMLAVVSYAVVDTVDYVPGQAIGVAKGQANPTAPAASLPKLEVTFENVTDPGNLIKVGDRFNAVFTVKNTPTLAGVQFQLNYNPAVFPTVHKSTGAASTSWNNTCTTVNSLVDMPITYMAKGIEDVSFFGGVDRAVNKDASISGYKMIAASYVAVTEMQFSDKSGWVQYYPLKDSQLVIEKISMKRETEGAIDFSLVPVNTVVFTALEYEPFALEKNTLVTSIDTSNFAVASQPTPTVTPTPTPTADPVTPTPTPVVNQYEITVSIDDAKGMVINEATGLAVKNGQKVIVPVSSPSFSYTVIPYGGYKIGGVSFDGGIAQGAGLLSYSGTATATKDASLAVTFDAYAGTGTVSNYGKVFVSGSEVISYGTVYGTDITAYGILLWNTGAADVTVAEALASPADGIYIYSASNAAGKNAFDQFAVKVTAVPAGSYKLKAYGKTSAGAYVYGSIVSVTVS